MGPREQDNDILLLVTVTLFCSIVAIGFSLMESTPSIAADSGTRVAAYQQSSDQTPVRVIVPFTPNTNPSAR